MRLFRTDHAHRQTPPRRPVGTRPVESQWRSGSGTHGRFRGVDRLPARRRCTAALAYTQGSWFKDKVINYRTIEHTVETFGINT